MVTIQCLHQLNHAFSRAPQSLHQLSVRGLRLDALESDAGSVISMDHSSFVELRPATPPHANNTWMTISDSQATVRPAIATQPSERQREWDTDSFAKLPTPRRSAHSSPAASGTSRSSVSRHSTTATNLQLARGEGLLSPPVLFSATEAPHTRQLAALIDERILQLEHRLDAALSK